MKKANIVLFLSSLALLAACGGKPSDSGSNTPSTYTPEQILNNLFNKIDEHHYSIDTPDFLHVDLYSDEFLSVNLLGEVSYYMNTNPQELYYVNMLEDETELDISRIRFRGKIKAIEAEAPNEYMINYWKSWTGENLWNEFTNYPDDPLRFALIKGESIYSQVLSKIGSIPNEYKNYVSSVDLVLDQEMPTSVNIVTTFEDEIEVEPMTTTIKFDLKREKTIVDSWLNDENRTYPAPKTKWDDADEFAFNSVFRRIREDQMDEVVPFPSEFATRTFYRYPNENFMGMTFYATDTLAKKEDMDKYLANLVKNYGYEKHNVIINGVVIDRYDKFLYDYQEIYHAYASIYVEYNEGEGVELLVEQNYNEINYQGRGALNNFLKDMNFPALEQADYLIDFEFSDETLIQNEGYLFLTPYKKALNVRIRHNNEAEAVNYLEAYYNLLEEQGFYRNISFISKTFGEEKAARLTSAYDEEYIYMLFWYIEYYDDDYATDWMNSYQFPLLDVKNNNSTTKDALLNFIYDSGVYHADALSIDVALADMDERETFLESYTQNLLADGFKEYEPVALKIARRDTAYYNEEKGLIVACNAKIQTAPNIAFLLIKVTDDFSPLYGPID